MVTDIKKLRQEAEQELAEERAKKAKEKLKAKLRERDTAQAVVNNLNREIELLEIELAGGEAGQ